MQYPAERRKEPDSCSGSDMSMIQYDEGDIIARERSADPGQIPAVPLPEPGEGLVPDTQTPADPGQLPVVPLPNPGEGSPVYPGSDSSALPPSGVRPQAPGIQLLPGAVYPVYPATASVRFLHAAYGYPPLRIFVGNTRAVSFLNMQSFSAYTRVPAGYRTVTVSGTDGYIYLQKTLPFEPGSRCTVAVVNRAGGLDLVQIADLRTAPAGYTSNLRVSNLAYNSGPMDVLLADGRVIYADLRFKETTSYKRIAPGAYEFIFAQTNQLPAPAYTDIESLDSAFIGAGPSADAVASLYLNVRAGANYTIFLVSSGTAYNAVTAIVAEDR